MRMIYILVLLIFFTSCNHEEITNLKKDNFALEEHNRELLKINERLQNDIVLMQNKIDNMIDDFHRIQSYASKANSNASSASFWYGTNDFFFKSDLDDMASNFNSIVSIASQY